MASVFFMFLVMMVLSDFAATSAAWVSAVHWNWMPSKAIWAGCPKMKSSRLISYTLRTARLMPCRCVDKNDEQDCQTQGLSVHGLLDVCTTGKNALSTFSTAHLFDGVLHAIHESLQPDLNVALGINRPLKLNLAGGQQNSHASSATMQPARGNRSRPLMPPSQEVADGTARWQQKRA